MADNYHNHDGWTVTSSSLRVFLRDPKEYYNRFVAKILPNPPTKSMELETAFHMATLELERFQREYYQDPHKSNAKESKRLAAEHVGKTRLTKSVYDRVLAMATAARQHPTAKKKCANGAVEVPVEAKMDNGLTIKCRPDLLTDATAYDLKSTGRPLNMFAEHALMFGYHI